jgi:high-affinity nickel-transport protein
MELAVGLMLALLGVLTLTGMRRGVGGGRAAQYTAMATTCIGIRMVTARTTTIMPVTERHWRCSTAVGSAAYHSINLLRPFAVGLVHGLAGSAAIALVVLTIIRDPIAAYLLLFGIGTISGMMLITLPLTAPFVFTSVNLPRFKGNSQSHRA